MWIVAREFENGSVVMGVKFAEKACGFDSYTNFRVLQAALDPAWHPLARMSGKNCYGRSAYAPLLADSIRLNQVRLDVLALEH